MKQWCWCTLVAHREGNWSLGTDTCHRYVGSVAPVDIRSFLVRFSLRDNRVVSKSNPPSDIVECVDRGKVWVDGG